MDTVLSERLRRLLKYNDISQEKLSEISAVSKSQISNIIRGKGDTSIETLSSICNALGITLADFFAKCPNDDIEIEIERRKIADFAYNASIEEVKMCMRILEIVKISSEISKKETVIRLEK